MPEDKGFHDLAENLEETKLQPGKRQKYYPTLHVTSSQLPGVGEKVGDSGVLTIKYKISGISQRRNERTNYTLELLAAKVGKEKEE